jgi:DNA-binding SARP family transcriptional activator
MLRLRTFGGLSLSRGDENLTGAASQRRRLAILVLLAVAGEAGMSRDKLVAYLWPESETERARHVLNQLLYAQRRQVGDDALFLGRKTLRVNRAVLTSDVGDLTEALARGALGEAVALYRGPFLDGFFVKDAGEFEHWVELHRGRYARQILEALATLATEAARRADLQQAIAWYRRAAELDPLAPTIALELVRALAAAGDRPGALRHARQHAEALKSELDMPADPRLLSLLESLKQATD